LTPQHLAAADDSQHRPVHAQRDPLPREPMPIWRPARTITAAVWPEVLLAAVTPDQEPRVLGQLARDDLLRAGPAGVMPGGR
jgi:hypothetical protein